MIYIVAQISSKSVYFNAFSILHVLLDYVSDYQVRGFRNVSALTSSDISFP